MRAIASACSGRALRELDLVGEAQQPDGPLDERRLEALRGEPALHFGRGAFESAEAESTSKVAPQRLTEVGERPRRGLGGEQSERALELGQGRELRGGERIGPGTIAPGEQRRE